MGNKYVKESGIATAVVGVILAVIGTTLEMYQEVVWTGIRYVVRRSYEDTGQTVWNIGLLAIVIGVALLVAGFALKPSIREVRQARRLVEKNWMRLQEYEKEEGI